MDHLDVQKKYCGTSFYILGGLALISLIILLSFLSYFFYKKTLVIGRPENVRDTISITGTGSVNAIPDIAIVEAGLETSAKTVGEAQKDNTKKMNQFLKDVDSYGVKEQDRKTTEYSIYPKYEYQKDGRQNLIGYSISNRVQLKIRDFAKLPDILQAIGNAGLNQVGSFSFSIDDDEKLKQEALEKAIKNTSEKADRLERVGNIHVGKIVSFQESSMPTPIAYDMRAGYELKNAAAPSAPPKTEAGTQEINVTVNVVYELLP